MARYQFKVSLKKPCIQNWDTMEKRDGGIYCQNCCKVVRDFTILSDEELISTLTAKRTTPVCGRFTATQLQKTYHLSDPTEKPRLVIAKVLLASLLALKLPIHSQSQSIKPKPPIVQNRDKKVIPLKPELIRGRVTDRQTKKSVHVNVTLYSTRLGGQGLISVETDSNGYYEIRLPKHGLKKLFRLEFYDHNVFNSRSIVVDRDKLPASLNVTMLKAETVEVSVETIKYIPEVDVITRKHEVTYGGIPPLHNEIITRRLSIWDRLKAFVRKTFHLRKGVR